ncbi:hypothetical protein [Streptomyces milbemycinicus]|uniref:hypothetical protein n=1 Tax=Streptomyces milbemycinicus TaxID=476552 RepID=UPI000A3A1337|nr:hypothetical protein [Streptomyces milbemycinicus]
MAGSTVLTNGVQVCSLKRDTPQLIQQNVYAVVRFPFGAAEPSDRLGMHQVIQPDGYVVTAWDVDDRSGLIWPSKCGWGHLYAVIQWEAPTETSGQYTELRDQYARDPLGINAVIDTTATDHRAPTPGAQFFTKSHGIYVTPSTPLALRVRHNASGPLNLTLAEFKLAIHEAA